MSAQTNMALGFCYFCILRACSTVYYCLPCSNGNAADIIVARCYSHVVVPAQIFHCVLLFVCHAMLLTFKGRCLHSHAVVPVQTWHVVLIGSAFIRLIFVCTGGYFYSKGMN